VAKAVFDLDWLRSLHNLGWDLGATMGKGHNVLPRETVPWFCNPFPDPVEMIFV